MTSPELVRGSGNLPVPFMRLGGLSQVVLPRALERNYRTPVLLGSLEQYYRTSWEVLMDFPGDPGDPLGCPRVWSSQKWYQSFSTAGRNLVEWSLVKISKLILQQEE